MFFNFFGEYKYVDCIYWIVLFLDQGLVMWYVISINFLKIQWHFLNLKKDSLVYLVWVNYIWVDSCF